MTDQDWQDFTDSIAALNHSPAIRSACPDQSYADGVRKQRMNPKAVLKSVVHHTNRERRRNGLPDVSANDQLSKAAQAHADWCTGRFRASHTGANKSQPVDRAKLAGFPFGGISENMWQMQGQEERVDGDDWELGKVVVASWMNSPGHRENLLDPRVKVTGVGASRRGDHTVLVQMCGQQANRGVRRKS